MLLWLVSAALAADWTVDTSSRTTARCPEPRAGARLLGGRPLHTLGVAAVVYSRKQGTMAWGHASLRATYCLGEELVDVEYESYRMSSWNDAQLRHEHAGEPFLKGDWLHTQRGSLVLFRNRDPVDAGWFADAQRHNREIYELWLDLPREELDRIVIEADAWYEEQLAGLRAGRDLPLPYRPLSTNCTYVLQALLPAELTGGRDPHLPFAWLRLLEETAKLRIVRPSAHLSGRWGQGQQVRRPRPILRSPPDAPR